MRFCRVPIFARVFRLFLAAYPSIGTRVPPDRNLGGTLVEHVLPSPPLYYEKELEEMAKYAIRILREVIYLEQFI